VHNLEGLIKKIKHGKSNQILNLQSLSNSQA